MSHGVLLLAYVVLREVLREILIRGILSLLESLGSVHGLLLLHHHLRRLHGSTLVLGHRKIAILKLSRLLLLLSSEHHLSTVRIHHWLLLLVLHAWLLSEHHTASIVKRSIHGSRGVISAIFFDQQLLFLATILCLEKLHSVHFLGSQTVVFKGNMVVVIGSLSGIDVPEEQGGLSNVKQSDGPATLNSPNSHHVPHSVDARTVIVTPSENYELVDDEKQKLSCCRSR